MRIPSPSRSAFTLLEVMIVVVILAIVAAIVIPSMATAGDSSQVLAASRTLTADIEYAQSVAVTERTPIYVLFDVAENSYKVARDQAGTNLLTHPVLREGFEIDFDDQGGTDRAGFVSVKASGSGADVTFVKFTETGAPDLTVDVEILLSAGNARKKVTLSAATGRILVSGG